MRKDEVNLQHLDFLAAIPSSDILFAKRTCANIEEALHISGHAEVHPKHLRVRTCAQYCDTFGFQLFSDGLGKGISLSYFGLLVGA